MESKSYLDRIKALGKVTNILNSAYLYDESRQITNLDMKLIKGFYKRALNEYKYLEQKGDDSISSDSSRSNKSIESETSLNDDQKTRLEKFMAHTSGQGLVQKRKTRSRF